MSKAASFVIRCPREVKFGCGRISELAEAAAKLGRRPLLALGGGSVRRTGVLDRLLTDLSEAGLTPALFEGIEHDPLVGTIDRGRGTFRDAGCDSVIAVGGGSVMDAGKAIAGLAREQAPTADFVAGQEIMAECYPVICCTTTSGTGSEVTHVSVLTDRERRLKASIRTEGMMPAVAIVDPELTVSMSPEHTAFTGLDAFTQAVESYVSRGANPYSDPLAIEASAAIGKALWLAYVDGTDLAARTDMALGSMLAGLALASARLGLVHGIAHPLGALYGLAHGEACALLLPHVMEYNLSMVANRYADIARAIGVTRENNSDKAALALLEWTEKLCDDLQVSRPFAEFGLSRDDYPIIVDATLKSGSTKANPRPVTETDVVELLDRAM